MNLGAIEIRTQASCVDLKPSFAVKQYLNSRHFGALLELSQKAALIGRSIVSALCDVGVFALNKLKILCFMLRVTYNEEIICQKACITLLFVRVLSFLIFSSCRYNVTCNVRVVFRVKFS